MRGSCLARDASLDYSTQHKSNPLSHPLISFIIAYLWNKGGIEIKVANYNLDMKTRVLNRRTNLGKMYLENI